MGEWVARNTSRYGAAPVTLHETERPSGESRYVAWIRSTPYPGAYGCAVNPETIDGEYSKLESEVQATTQAIQALADKLQSAAAGGDADASQWLLDLKSIALQVRQDQLQMQAIMQAMHDFTVSHLTEQAAQPQPAYVPRPAYAMQQPMMGGGGGILGRFMGGGFGRAMAMGAGFGLGDDIINSIFR